MIVMINNSRQQLARQLLCFSGAGNLGTKTTTNGKQLFIGSSVKSFNRSLASATTKLAAGKEERAHFFSPANQSIPGAKHKLIIEIPQTNTFQHHKQQSQRQLFSNSERPRLSSITSQARRSFSVGSSRLFSEHQGNTIDAAATTYKTIRLSTPCKHVLSIELNRPKSKNSFGLDTAAEFLHLFRQIELDRTIRCVILSGQGDDFTSGVDLKSFMQVYAQLQQTEDVAHRAKLLRNVVEEFQAPFKQMYSCSKPIICLAHGLCLGLGIELAACSDIRLLCRDSRLAIREVLIGIAADVGSLQLLPRLVANQSLLSELIYTGRYLTPDEALNLGFASRIGQTKADSMNEALELAKTIVSRSPLAVQGSKQNLRFSLDKPFLVGLDYNAVWNGAMMQGADVVKAIEAILSKNEQVDYENF